MTSESETEIIKINKHEFIHKYLKKPTWCGICNEFIVGVTLSQQNAYKCLCCKLIGHYNCLPLATNECIKKKVDFNTDTVKKNEFSEVTDVAMRTYMGSSAQKAGQTLQRVNQYEILGELGRGSFGKVYLVQDPSKVKYAMKSFPHNIKNNANLNRAPKGSKGLSKTEIIYREIAIMKRLNHPNLVSLKEVIEDIGESKKLYIVLEYVDGGMIVTSVENSNPAISPTFIAPRGINGRYPEQQASRLFRQILSGMSYLHGNKIVHRDLKPDNILVTLSGVVKLTDFGVSKDFADASTQSSKNGFVGDTQGTWPFWSPEMCDDDEDDDEDEARKYSALAADVWAAGVVLYILLFGKLPFWSDDMLLLFEKIGAMKKSSSLEYPIDDVKSPQAIQLLESMLKGDPNQRPSFAECVQYEWIQKYSDADIERDLVEASSQIVSHAAGEDMAHAVTPGEALFISSAVKKKLSSAVAKLTVRSSSGRDFNNNNNSNNTTTTTTTSSSEVSIPKLPSTPTSSTSSRESDLSSIVSTPTSDKNRQYYEYHGHLYYQKFLKKMTWCTICQSFVWGLTSDQQQAFKCKKCKLVGHIECCKKYEHNCACEDLDLSAILATPTFKKYQSTTTDGDDYSERESIVTSTDMTEETVYDRNNHEWQPKYLSRPTNCTICHQFVWGVTLKQQKAYKCKKCKIRGHRDCCLQYDELCCSETDKLNTSQHSSTTTSSRLSGSYEDIPHSGLKKLNQYQVVEELGNGKFHGLYLAEDPSHTFVVIKKNPPLHGVSDMESIHKEILVLKRLTHPHLVKFLEAIEEINDPRQFYLVLEYIQGSIPLMTSTIPTNLTDSPCYYGTKESGDGKYTESQSSRLFRQILSGLVYLHGNGIVHRDIKIENILLTSNGTVKIIGFGTIGQTTISIDRRRTIIPYLPPELTEKGKSILLQNITYTYATDVWAAGVVLYILLFGKLPFWSDDMLLLFEKIGAMKKSSSLEYPIDDVKSPQAIQLLESMLKGDPNQRPSFAECVQYEWIQKYSDADIERDLVEASSQIVSKDPTNTNAVTPGIKMEKRKSLSQMIRSSMKDISHEKNHHHQPSSNHISMSHIDEFVNEVVEDHQDDDIIIFHGHEWKRKYFNRPSWCSLCNGFIAGVTKEMQNSYKCRKCKKYAHAACLSTSEIECEGCLDDSKTSS